MTERVVGTVTHYWSGLGVAGVEVSGDLSIGDTIRVVGHTSDFTQVVDSIQIDHKNVESAKPGDSIGLGVQERARVHDQVLVVTPD